MAGELFGIIDFINGTVQTVNTIASWWNESFNNPYEARFALIYKDTSAIPASGTDLVAYLNGLIHRPAADDFRVKQVGNPYTVNLPGNLQWYDGSTTKITVIEFIAGDPAVDPLCTFSGAGEPLEESCVWGYPSYYLLHGNDVAEGINSIMNNHPQPRYVAIGSSKDQSLSQDVMITSLTATGLLKERTTPTPDDGDTTTGDTSNLLLVGGIIGAIALVMLLLK